jgi:hypothetical protein
MSDLFNDAKAVNNPSTAKDAGHGFLFRRGYTVLWCGWMGDLLPGQDRMLMKAPIATDGGKPITGVVRHEIVADAFTESVPLSNREDHGSYPPTEKGEREGVLTWRLRQADERVVIPRAQWSLVREKVPAAPEKGVPATLGLIRLKISGGFRPGYIYELVCESEGPIVQGLGFAATRDLISFLKYDTTAQNPLLLSGGKSAVTRAHAFGISQCGRFIRHFLYQGFNADEQDRRVFDGLMPHVAGGGLIFGNHRFAQPSRHNGQHKEHYYPADVFPFGYGETEDAFLGSDGKVVKRGDPDGILKRLAADKPDLMPKVMHTQTSSEYWHRSGSLVHTDTLGIKDATVPANVRIYVFGGTQHNPGGWPATKTGFDHKTIVSENPQSPGDHRPQLRALLDALDAWVKDGKEPPASVYPRIDEKTLVDWRQASTGFPALPGVRYPEVIQRPSALDLGPDFRTRGRIATDPPKLLGEYVMLAPKADADGNDLGCLRPLEVAVPVATNSGWNLRHKDVGAEGELASLSVGSYLPFPKTKAEREATGDPRKSIAERYVDFAGFQKEWETAQKDLLKKRFLLDEDVERLKEKLERSRPLFTNVK